MKDRKMCNKNNDKSSKTSKGKKPTTLVSSKPFRRARTKMKKLKFLSLSNTTQLQTVPSCEPTHTAMVVNTSMEQVELFPAVQRDGIGNKEEPESMADQMFSEEGPGPTTLTGLLNGTVSSTTTATATATSELSYYGATPTQDSVNSARSLVRTAMRRSREREEGSEEERWVSISDVHVVDRRSSEEEVTSSGGGGGGSRLWLRLKLDYEQVLNAWSDSGKGPFYLQPYHLHHQEEDPPQTVPDLGFHQHPLLPHWNGTDKDPWSVPEKSLNGQNRCHTQIGCSTGEEAWKMGLREASVLRYKEKRQSRLFRKRIRYEVRKLNAEKRPRIKGRFVKRCVD